MKHLHMDAIKPLQDEVLRLEAEAREVAEGRNGHIRGAFSEGASMTEIAAHAGLSRNTIGKIVHGK